MFSDVTVNPGVGSGLGRDTVKPEYRSKLLALARRRNSNATDDVSAVFKEGERSPIREAAAA